MSALITRLTPSHALRPLSRRSLATASSSPPPIQVFNRNAKRMQRDRSALDPSASRRVDYLKDAVAERLVERLMVIPTSQKFALSEI